VLFMKILHHNVNCLP